MAKIYIKSRQEPIIIENAKALMVKEDWLSNPKSQDIVEVSGEVFKLYDIKSISGAFARGEDFSGKKYNLDVPADRAKIKGFEKEFLGWAEGKGYNAIMMTPRFFEEKGACRVRGEGKYLNDVIITDPVLYERLSSMWSALQDLKSRRQKAKEMESESMNSLIKGKEELKEKTRINKLEIFKSKMPPKEKEQFEEAFGK